MLAAIGVLFGTLALPALSGAADIGKITKFEGKVVVVSGDKLETVKKVDHPVKSGDRIQTEQGEAEVTMTDGALLKVRPFTTVAVDERTEERGILMFKKKQDVRRVTDMVGKVWFKSGSSDKKNYLQTPTAVCALRGSDGDIGYDGKLSYLNMFTGQADSVGKILRGAFGDFGQAVANNSAVYNAIIKAGQLKEGVKAGDTKSERTAAMGLHEAIKIAATEMQKCPDPQVQQYAAVVIAVAEAQIAAVQAQQVADDAKAAVDKAKADLAAAQQAGDAAVIKEAEAKVEAVQEMADQAAATAESVTQAAMAAAESIAEGNVSGLAEALSAAETVINEVQDLIETINEIVPIEVLPPPDIIEPPPPPPPEPLIYQDQ